MSDGISQLVEALELGRAAQERWLVRFRYKYGHPPTHAEILKAEGALAKIDAQLALYRSVGQPRFGGGIEDES